MDPITQGSLNHWGGCVMTSVLWNTYNERSLHEILFDIKLVYTALVLTLLDKVNVAKV